MKIQDSVAIVTGGAGLLGRALCNALFVKGGKVCIADNDEEASKVVVEEYTTKYGNGKCIYLNVDVTRKESFEDVFSKTEALLGPVDILINNAAYFVDPDYEKVVETNLTGLIHGTMLALKKMGKDNGGRGGHIINVSSESGFTPFLCKPMYSATKSAVTTFTLCWAHDWHREAHGVHLNVLCPGTLERPANMHWRQGNYHYREKEGLELLRKGPTVSPSAVAGAVITLIEEDINGETVKAYPEGTSYHPHIQFLPYSRLPADQQT